MNETINLTPRQKEIVNLLSQRINITRENISESLSDVFSVSKATLARDLKTLTQKGLITSESSGPNTSYKAVSHHPLLAYVDLDQYFLIDPDDRTLTQTSFDKKFLTYCPDS